MIILKFTLSTSTATRIYVRNPTPLSVQLQATDNTGPKIWVRSDRNGPDGEKESVLVVTPVVTGQEVPDMDLGDFIGTVQLFGGQFVVHYFAKIQR